VAVDDQDVVPGSEAGGPPFPHELFNLGAPPFSPLFGERVGSEGPIPIHGVWRDIADTQSMAG